MFAASCRKLQAGSLRSPSGDCRSSSMTHILDTRHLGRPGIIAATVLETDGGPILFDTGPESTFENVESELRKLGFAPRDIRHVFLSHIHFDHAGAAWRFA